MYRSFNGPSTAHATNQPPSTATNAPAHARLFNGVTATTNPATTAASAIAGNRCVTESVQISTRLCHTQDPSTTPQPTSSTTKPGTTHPCPRPRSAPFPRPSSACANTSTTSPTTAGTTPANITSRGPIDPVLPAHHRLARSAPPRKTKRAAHSKAARLQLAKGREHARQVCHGRPGRANHRPPRVPWKRRCLFHDSPHQPLTAAHPQQRSSRSPCSRARRPRRRPARDTS